MRASVDKVFSRADLSSVSFLVHLRRVSGSAACFSGILRALMNSYNFLSISLMAWAMLIQPLAGLHDSKSLAASCFAGW